MVATKVLISLCMLGLTAAASTRPRTGRQNNNEAQIVSTVVNTLQPEIASAVANALAALQAQQEAELRAQQEAQLRAQQEAQLRAQQEAQRRAQQEAQLRAEQEAQLRREAELRAQEEAAAAAAATRAQYNYQYQVRDDESQTYIYKNEARDGDEVNGVYGYVNPEGTLVTINYRAGPDGFYQTVENEENFLSSGSGSSSSFGSNSGVSRVPVPAPAPAPARPALDESALIAQIVAALQPQITASVNSAISQQQSVVRSSGFQSGGVSASGGDRLVPLFGFDQA